MEIIDKEESKMGEKDYRYVAGDLKTELDEVNRMKKKETEEVQEFTKNWDSFLTIICC